LVLLLDKSQQKAIFRLNTTDLRLADENLPLDECFDSVLLWEPCSSINPSQTELTGFLVESIGSFGSSF
jgi:hypothetical protein